MSCCEPIFLGCFNSCNNIQLPFTSDYTGLAYFIQTVGQKRSYKIGVESGEFIVIPANILNESALITFEIEKLDGTKFEYEETTCFQIRTEITIGGTDDVIAPAVGTFVSSFNGRTGDVTFSCSDLPIECAGAAATWPTITGDQSTVNLSGFTNDSGFIAGSRLINTSGSLTGGGDLTADRTFSLVNDNATPGNSQYYGTNGAGTKGFFALPTGNVGTVTSITAGAGLTGGTITGSGTIAADFGTTSGTIAQGDDSRFHDAVTIGTGNGLSLVGQTLSLATASGSTTGALTAADWTTFNNKESSKWTTSGSDIYRMSNVGVGITNPTVPLHVVYTPSSNYGATFSGTVNSAIPATSSSFANPILGGTAPGIQILNTSGQNGRGSALVLGAALGVVSLVGRRQDGAGVFEIMLGQGGANYARRLFLNAVGYMALGSPASGSTDPVRMLHIFSTVDEPQIRLQSFRKQITVGSFIAGMEFYAFSNASATEAVTAAISSIGEGLHAFGDQPTGLAFSTTSTGSVTPVERLRIDKDGRLGVNINAPLAQLHSQGNSTTVGEALRVTNSTPTSRFKVYNNGEVEATNQEFYLGDIATDGSWRLLVSGTDLLIQRREAGIWTTKSTISA